MTNEFLAVLLGLTAAIGWGISGFFDAKASRVVPPLIASVAVNGLLTCIYVLCYFLFLHAGFTMSQNGVIYAILAGATIAVGALAYFKALAVGPVSLASPMSSAYPLVTTLLAVFLFGTILTTGQGIAIGIILVGILAVTEFLQHIKNRRVISRGPLLGLLTALCWGIGYAFLAQAIQMDGWQQATLVELIAMMATFGLSILFIPGRPKLTVNDFMNAIRSRYIILASSVALVAALSFNIGLSHDTTGGAIVTTFSAGYPILTVLLALRHFKEPAKRVQLIGVSLSITGVILLVTL